MRRRAIVAALPALWAGMTSSSAVAGTVQTPTASNTDQEAEDLDLVSRFMRGIVSGRRDATLALLSDDARIIFGRATPSEANPLYGTWVGQEGARTVFERFGELIEPGEVVVKHRLSTQGVVVIYGTMRHSARATGRPFPSDWVLFARVQGGKITLYHFFEDTAALEHALGTGCEA